MECPICNEEMATVEVDLDQSGKWSSMKVDICEDGCGGLWFDNFELEKVDEPHEAPGEQLMDESADIPDEDETQERDCPDCDDIVMRQFFFTVRREVEVDECPGCGGVWLDAGELARIRSQFESEEARDEAFHEKVDQRFGEKIEENLEDAEEFRDTGESVANSLKFITPSYYIEGDQEAGAF